MALPSAAATLVFFTLACARAPGPWRAPVARDDVRVGAIYDVASGEKLAWSELVLQSRAADWLLLGEKHDNADHHRLQAELLAVAAEGARAPAVTFEMLRPSQARALADHVSADPTDVDGIEAAVGWNASGWPAFVLYRPIFAVVAERGLLARAGAPSKDVSAKVRAGGLEGLPAERRAGLGLDTPLAPSVREALEGEIREGHCGHAPEAHLARMIEIQRLRDALLADTLVRSGRPGVLIAGNGHVREDRGAPVFLTARTGADPLSIAFVEVDLADPTVDLAPFRGAYDIVVFTPRVDAVDPCEKFREQLEKMGRTPEGTGPSGPVSE